MHPTSEPRGHIYLLTDATGIRYVGVSVAPSRRLKAHLWESLDRSRRTFDLPKNRWLRKVGPSLRLRVLWSGAESACYAREPLVIAECRRRGHRILNVAEGGRRPPRINLLPNASEVRARISRAATGRVISKETRRRMSDAHKGKAGHLAAFQASHSSPANKPVVRCLPDGTPVETYRSSRAAAAAMGVHPSSICDGVKGRSKLVAGFAWTAA